MTAAAERPRSIPRTALGLLLCLVSLVAVCWGLYELVRTGTCASGGPYVSARQCPEGTGLRVLAVIGGVVLGLIGTLVYATAGGRDGGPLGLALLMWVLGFTLMGASALVAAFGPAAYDRADSRTGAIIVGGLFIPMGLAPLLLVRGGRRRARRLATLVRTGRRAPGRVVSVEDTGVTVNDDPRVEVTVEVQPEGEPSFTASKTAVVSRVAIPRPGDPVAVWYDPADRSRVAFGLGPGAEEVARGETPATPAAKSKSARSGADEPDDPLERLRLLGELRESGVLTEEEFAAQKARILRESGS